MNKRLLTYLLTSFMTSNVDYYNVLLQVYHSVNGTRCSLSSTRLLGWRQMRCPQIRPCYTASDRLTLATGPTTNPVGL